MSLRRAIGWSIFWIMLSFTFALGLSVWRSQSAAQLFLAGYVMEKALSIDNLMVFAAIFAYFRISPETQIKILYLGFFGAALFRFLFLASGVALMGLHPAIGATFAAIVFGTAVQMLCGGDNDDASNYEAKWFVRLARKVSTTPAFICLIAIECSDIIFSFDSMPAVIAITRDPLIVYSAVMFAVLGLRSMYFLLAALMERLSRLNLGVVAILFFVSAKLMARSVSELVGYAPLARLDIGPAWTLTVVAACLAIGIIASILFPATASQDA